MKNSRQTDGEHWKDIEIRQSWILLSRRDDVMLWTFKKWRNTGVSCTVLPEEKGFKESFSLNQLLDVLNSHSELAPYCCGVLVSPELPKWQKHHDYGCCWVNRTWRSQVFVHHIVVCIYNAWPGLQDSSLWAHRHIHNLQIHLTAVQKSWKILWWKTFDNVNTANR